MTRDELRAIAQRQREKLAGRWWRGADPEPLWLTFVTPDLLLELLTQLDERDRVIDRLTTRESVA